MAILSVEARLRVEPDSGTTDIAPSIDSHLGPSNIVPLFQHSADQNVEAPSVRTINRTEHSFHHCLYYCLLLRAILVSSVFLIFFHNRTMSLGM
jgi:hypothetical protein